MREALLSTFQSFKVRLAACAPFGPEPFATSVHGHSAVSATSEVRFEARGALLAYLPRVFVHGEATGDAEKERSRAQLCCRGAAHRHVRAT